MQLFMGHIVPCLHFIERENIFSSCVSSTQFFFLNLVCVFFFIPNPFIFPQNSFSQHLFCVSYFYRERGLSLTLVVHRRNCCFSQEELSLFSLTLLRMFSIYLLIRQTLSIRDKKGEMKCENMWESYLFCLGGDKIVFQRGRI